MEGQGACGNTDLTGNQGLTHTELSGLMGAQIALHPQQHLCMAQQHLCMEDGGKEG